MYFIRETYLYHQDTQSDFDSADENQIVLNNNNERKQEEEEFIDNEEEVLVNDHEDLSLFESIEIELDSIYIELNNYSFINMKKNFDKDLNIINNITIYNQIQYDTSETFKKFKHKPVSIGYINLLNYKTNIIVWTNDSISVVYNKLLVNIKSDIEKKNKTFNDQYEIMSNLNNISRLPPIITPTSKPITIAGEEIVILLLEGLVKLFPTSLYIRGSKLPIIRQYNQILKFNQLLINLLNPFNNDEIESSIANETAVSTNIKNRIKNRIDWAYNFFESINICFNINDVNYLISYIENYFISTNEIFLKIKVKTNFTNHYLIEDSNCFRGDIFCSNEKIGQILMYYHNTSIYRNEIIGNGRISPLGLNLNQSEIIKNNSARDTVTNFYKIYKDSLQNGLIKRIEIRLFSFNEITLQFPLILCNLVNNLSKRFNDRMINEFDMFITDNRSLRLLVPSSCLPAFFNNDSHLNDKISLFNSYYHYNFQYKVKVLTDMLDNSISHINFDLVSFIIIEEILFIGYNGFRKTGFKYSFSKKLLTELLNFVISIDFKNRNSSMNIIRDLKLIFYNENKKIISSYNLDGEKISLNKVIDYSMINDNFLFKEIYSIETAYRILSIITQTNNTLLNEIIDKFNSYMSTDIVVDNEVLIYKFTSKIIELILIPQLYCELYQFFSFNDKKEKHEWIPVIIPVLSFGYFTCFYKKQIEVPQEDIIKQAIYNGKFCSCPNNHFIRENNRKQRSSKISISNYVDLLYNILSDNCIIQKINEKPLFQSSKMILNIILFYIKKFSISINCKQILMKKILSTYMKEKQTLLLTTEKEILNYTLYFPELVDGNLNYLHNKGKNGYMWVTIVPDSKITKKLEEANLAKVRINLLQNKLKENNDPFYEEITSINSIFSNVSLKYDFKYFIYLQSIKISKEQYRKSILLHNCSLHLLNYWDIIERNREILLTNSSSFIIFLKKSCDHLFLTKNISKIITARSILYILYCSTIVLCNNPCAFTKNYRKADLVNVFPFFHSNGERQSPASIEKTEYLSFCNQLN